MKSQKISGFLSWYYKENKYENSLFTLKNYSYEYNKLMV